MDCSNIIKIEKIRKSFPTWGMNRLEIFSNFSLIIKENEVIHLEGPNGSGKSTLIKILAGIEKIDEGKIYFENNDVTDQKIFKRAKYIKFINQNPLENLFPNLSIYNNFCVFRNSKNNRIILEEFKNNINKFFPLLSDKINSPLITLSGGQIQLAALFIISFSGAKVILLDEFISQISETQLEYVYRFFDDFILNKIRSKIKAIIIVSHSLGALHKVINRKVQLQ
jgi:ABC-type sugar transport system ATPase subunit